ncbi:putative nuclease HARBI1 [Heptranchias perlo]|uniref:putative nuclease HARBI1 n=1 Tax=Heptranchias perlo TaxID=212740 RepID=UPI00355A84CF
MSPAGATTQASHQDMGSFQAAAGDFSDISQFVVHRYIREISDALYTRRNAYISFLMDRLKQDKRALGFTCMAGFPRVQHAVDCTHIALRASYHQPGIFIDLKGFHSLNIQLVCDHRQPVMQVCAKYPGSSRDSFIVCQSSVLPLFQPGSQVAGWLLGNNGCPFQIWCVTPVRNPGTAAEQVYNESHAATRKVIEQIIGELKQCFHCLDRSGGVLQCMSEQVSRFVIICYVLHNCAIIRDQPLPPPGQQEAQ